MWHRHSASGTDASYRNKLRHRRKWGGHQYEYCIGYFKIFAHYGYHKCRSDEKRCTAVCRIRSLLQSLPIQFCTNEIVLVHKLYTGINYNFTFLRTYLIFKWNQRVVVPRSSACPRPTITSIRYTIFLPLPLRFRTMTIAQSLIMFVHMLPFVLVFGSTTASFSGDSVVSGCNITAISLSSFAWGFASFITKTTYIVPTKLISRQIEINSAK